MKQLRNSRDPWKKTIGYTLTLLPWVIACGLVGWGIEGLVHHHEKEARLHWGGTTAKNAAVIASDVLIDHYGVRVGMAAQPVGAPKKISVAGDGRDEWLLKYRAGKCFYTLTVWHHDNSSGSGQDYHTVFSTCRKDEDYFSWPE